MGIRNIKTGEVTFEGAVLRVFYRETKVMSDVWANLQYAQVWDEEKQATRDISLGWDTPSSTAEVDVTPETQAKVDAFVALVARKRQERRNREAIRAALREHNEPRNGKQMVVARGRKVPKGTVGVVFWLGQDSYGNAKAGLRTSDEKDGHKWKDVVWVAARHLEPVESFRVEDHFDMTDEIRKAAEEVAKES